MRRLTPSKRNFCSTDAWQHLLVAINKTERKLVEGRRKRVPVEEVQVKAKYLLEVEECHASKTYYLDRLSRHCRPGRRGRLHVVRSELWKLVQDHGKVCGN